MARVLVVQSQSVVSGVLSEMLETLQHKVVAVQTVSQAISLIAGGDIDTAVIDANDCSSAVTCLTAMKNNAVAGATPVIVATATATADQVIETMRLGALDHLSKPIDKEQLNAVLTRALSRPRATAVSDFSQAQPGDFLIGLSTAMRNVTKQIGMAAACEATVLVQGPTGSGKDTVARTIHRHSQHKEKPVTVIDCIALPEDYHSFQSLGPGAQGTVILDEIGDLSARSQAMLVRALRDAPAGLRIIATTQYDLIRMAQEKRFREDLYYRLNVLPICLPPLKERGSDVIALAEAFLQQAHGQDTICLSSSACKVLLDYHWPGNVRELQNVMYHLSATVRTGVVEAGDLPPALSPGSGTVGASAEEQIDENNLDYQKAIATLEIRLLKRALEAAKGSRSEAARMLGINRQLLYAKLKTYKLHGE